MISEQTRKAVNDLKNTIRNPFAWPGGYPVYIVVDDGEMLCHECTKKEYRTILDSTRREAGDGWQVIGADVLWENEEGQTTICPHCGKEIEPAYSED